jgi:hypothetical protein
MTVTGISLVVLVAVVIFLLKAVHDLKENVEAVREYYMYVYLVRTPEQ